MITLLPLCLGRKFQSTLPHGSDADDVVEQHKAPISIHAPSRERHLKLFPCVAKILYFNPRSLTGATKGSKRLFTATAEFQSTLPHGSDSCG